MIKDKLNVHISHIKDSSGKIVYEIKVSRGSNEPKVSHKRYSDLDEFHNQIQKNISLLKLQVISPEFPKRKMFGSTNKSEEYIQERQKKLQNYFFELFNHEKLQNLPIVQTFIPSKLLLQDVTSGDKFEQSITVSIERYQVFDEVVVYFLRFIEKPNYEQWTYKLRYSELKQINIALQESKLKSKLPQFPQKKTFGSTNDDPESIEQRREQLESYLNDLLSTEEFFNNQVVQFIISDSKQEFQKFQILDNMKKSKQQKQVRGDLNQQFSTTLDGLSKSQNEDSPKIQVPEPQIQPSQQFLQE